MAAVGATKRRWVLPAILSIVLVLIGAFGVKAIWFVTSQPTISVNYAVEHNERMRPTGADPNHNAAPYYQDAFACLPDIPYDFSHSLPAWQDEPNGVRRQAVESWLVASEPALQIIRQAAQEPDYWIELSTINIQDSVWLDGLHLTKFRTALFALRYRIQFQAMKDNVAEAWDDLVTMCRMARHVSSYGKVQINFGHAVEALAYTTAFDLFSHTEIDAGLLRKFQGQLEEIVACRAPLSFWSDEILLRDAVQRYFTDNGRGDGHLIPRVIYAQYRQHQTPRNELAANLACLRHVYIAWRHPSRVQTVRTLESLFRKASELAERAPWELHAQGTSYDVALVNLTRGNYFHDSLRTAETLARTIEGFYVNRATAEALVTTLGLLRFHKDRGTWPGSLEELAAGYVRQVPLDPYSGRPLVYKQANGSFTLYSLGLDFDDDGGTPIARSQPLRGDRVFWPVEERRK